MREMAISQTRVEANSRRGQCPSERPAAAGNMSRRQPDADSDSPQTHVEEAMRCGRGGGASRGSMCEGVHGYQGCGGAGTTREGLLFKICPYF